MCNLLNGLRGRLRCERTCRGFKFSSDEISTWINEYKDKTGWAELFKEKNLTDEQSELRDKTLEIARDFAKNYAEALRENKRLLKEREILIAYSAYMDKQRKKK